MPKSKCSTIRTISRVAALGVVVTLLSHLTSCAHHATTTQDPNPWEAVDRDPRALEDSEVELIYLYGHDRHQFKAEARQQKIRARTFAEKEVLREGTIEAVRYRELLKRVAVLAAGQASISQGSLNKSGNRAGCRAPFLARARVGDSTYLLNGCRHTESGIQFGRIVRDAEFLLIAPGIPVPAAAPATPSPSNPPTPLQGS